MTTTLITGANRGIGLELVRGVLASGHSVIGTARDPDAASALRETGARVEALDASDEGSVQALAGRLAGEPIDVLINNAGVFPDRDQGFETLDAAAMTACFATNTVGPLLVTRALLPNLLTGGAKKVVHITSTMGSLEQARSATKNHAYRASKAALNMVTVLMANELRDRGVVCVAVHPGWVQTDMGGAEAHLTPAQSASDILALAERVTMEDTGSFRSHDGAVLPW
jgi:NAD(P)-dependent dehydrogenase (short-subunit alcohol dehydrogenase family)